MIPKKIHYCWFGRGEKPKLAKKCIASWKKYCPDYEIIEWNEDNFDVHQNPYVEYLYANKKYAFLSDYARLLIIYENGGIYFDTDVEVIKPIDDLLDNHAYFGFETPDYINTGLGFGAEKNHAIIKELLKEYEPYLDGLHGYKGCPVLNTEALLKNGLIKGGETQSIGTVTIYSPDYFNPYDDPTGRLNITDNTYSIHWFAKTWMTRSKRIRSRLTKPYHRLLSFLSSRGS